MSFFFFNDTATTEIYTLSLHDALPISQKSWAADKKFPPLLWNFGVTLVERAVIEAFNKHLGINFPQSLRENRRSEEHTSELQSQSNLVCRLLLEKKTIQPSVVLTPCSS